MSSYNNSMDKNSKLENIFEGVSERHPLTADEKRTVLKAKNQFRKYDYVPLINHFYLGFIFSVAGSLLGGSLVARSKKPTILRGLLLSTGFGFISLQLGLAIGAAKGIKTIKEEFEDKQKVKDIFREFVETANKNKRKDGLPILQPPEHPKKQEYSNPEASSDKNLFSTTERVNISQSDGSAWDRVRNSAMAKPSAWDQILQGEVNSPSITEAPNYRESQWGKIRQNQSDDFSDYASKAPEEKPFSDPFTTRPSEDGIKRNKYGDIIELPDESIEAMRRGK